MRVLFGLSRALDLVSRGSLGLLHHGVSVGYIALSMARDLRLSQPEAARLLTAALIHDIGISSSRERETIVGIDFSDASGHCRRGASRVALVDKFSGLAPVILHHHDNFNGENSAGLAGVDIPLMSRIIYVADRAAIMAHKRRSVTYQRKFINLALRTQAGRVFDPELVDSFERVSKNDSFWLDLGSEDIYNILELMEPGLDTITCSQELLHVAGLLATIIDDKSHFTHDHSWGVANVARQLAQKCGMSDADCEAMRVAGLLHDVGKLAVADEILEKPGPLTPDEWVFMRHHAYYTHRLLCQMPAFCKVAGWAGYHHERLDGTGYPFGIPADDLDLGSRIMAVADVFQALKQSRPYRGATPDADVSRIIQSMARERKIDASVVALVLDDIEAYSLLC